LGGAINLVNKDVSNKSLLIAAIPSFIVLIVTIFFDYVYEMISSSVLPDSIREVKSLWLYPTIVYIVFILCFIWSKKIVLDKVQKNNTSKTEVIKIIEKWSGIVDGIGTALPLVGAAVILFTVGLGKDYQGLFLNFAVPFEIKSLLILAFAKLFESVFDEFEVQIQEMYDRVEDSESLILKDTKIEFKNLPDKQTLIDINNTISSWNEVITNLKDPKLEENLNKILKITGRS
jgi:hypothetical protein